MRNCITDENNNKNKMNELKGALKKKDAQEEEQNIIIASSEEFERILLNYEKKQDK